MGNNGHSRLVRTPACQWSSIQTRSKQASLANNGAFSNTQTCGSTTRIHGTIGGTSVKLLHNINYMHYAIAHDQFYATDEEIKKVWIMMKMHLAIVYHIPWWERKARIIKARQAGEHWQFNLFKRQFKISYDNHLIVHIFHENKNWNKPHANK